MEETSKVKEIPLAARAIVQSFLDEIIKISNRQLLAVYLTGSVSLNDYYAGKSDIDFLILCKEIPDTKFRRQLENVHSLIKQKFKKSNLSGIYLAFENLNIPHSHTFKTLSYHEGQMRETNFDAAPITLFELKTTAITLFGIPAQELPVTTQINDVNKYLFENINSYWKNWIGKSFLLSRRKWLLVIFPRLTEWVVLGVARQLYTLRTGKITSKTGAGYYCLLHLPAEHHAILEQAIAIRKNTVKHLISLKSSYYIQPSIKRAEKTIKCARSIIELFNNEYKEYEKKTTMF